MEEWLQIQGGFLNVADADGSHALWSVGVLGSVLSVLT